jgi:hypothetical protein
MYHASELGLTEDRMVSVYRPEEEVFDRRALGSFKSKPITLGHPGERVTADNHKKYSRGHIANVARDGEAVALDVAITDGEIVKMITKDGGPRELSAGYMAVIDWTAGVTEDGVPYDAVQRNIFVDHLAIVNVARAGHDFRIGDGQEEWGARPLPRATEPKKEAPMADNDKSVTVTVGDGAVRTDEAGAIRIKGLQTELGTKTAELSDAQTRLGDLQKQIETKDGEIAALRKELETKTSPAALADAARKRASLVDSAKKAGLTDAAIDSLDDAGIRRAVVVKTLGDAAKDMSDAAIEGAFAVAVKNAGTSSPSSPLGDGIKSAPTGHAGDEAYAARLASMKDAWKAPKQETH